METNKRKVVSDSNETDFQNKKKKQITTKEKLVKKSDKNVAKMKKTGKKSKSVDSDELCSMADQCLKPNGISNNDFIYLYFN